MSTPSVSIIIPVFNREAVLSETIASVREQTLEDWELLLIDDGSEDSSSEICCAAAYEDSRIRTLRTVNQGQCVARNIGVAMAKSDFVKFLDSDDLLATRALEVQMAAIRRYDASIARFGLSLFQSDEIEQKKAEIESAIIDPKYFEHREMDSVIEFHRIIPTTFNEIIIRKSLVESAGGFLPSLTAAEESTLLMSIAIRVGNRQKIITTDFPLLLKRLDDNSLAVQVRHDGRGLSATLLSNLRLIELIGKFGEPSPGLLTELLSNVYQGAIYSYRNGNLVDSHKAIKTWTTAGSIEIPKLTPSYHHRLHQVLGFWNAERLLGLARKSLAACKNS